VIEGRGCHCRYWMASLTAGDPLALEHRLRERILRCGYGPGEPLFDSGYARIIRQELLALDGHAAKRKQINTPISLGQTHTLRPRLRSTGSMVGWIRPKGRPARRSRHL
jgi:hypothetical protein